MIERRNFWLINAEGRRYDLRNDRFSLTSPEGLGFSKGLETERVENIETLINETYEMPKVGAELLFHSERKRAYQNYYEFIKFITLKPIKLFYQTPNQAEAYYIDCEITEVDKSEYEGGLLRCPITFVGLSFWKTDNERTIIVSSEITGEAKDYPLGYPYSYGANGLSGIEIRNEGTKVIGMKIVIDGECTNPQWTVSDVNGNAYGVGKLIGTFDYVEVCSIDGDENIVLKVGSSTLSNPYSYQDLSIGSAENLNITFLKLKVGINTVAFSLGNEFEGEVRITYQPTYSTV